MHEKSKSTYIQKFKGKLLTQFMEKWQCWSSFMQNRVLQERLSHMETQLKASEEDSQRLRVERDGLRDRLSELHVKLTEKEAEVKIRH